MNETQGDITYVKHPLIKPDTVEQRTYQLAMAKSATAKSTLIVLPTGLGKTIIALLLMAERLNTGKVLMLSPTKPLVEQHYSFLKNALQVPEDEIVLFTGSTRSDKREEMWQKARVIISTPQVIENGLLGKKLDLTGVSLVIFDEAHRAVGNYSYVYIAEKYIQQVASPLILGITASPGSEAEKILEVCKNLHIENTDVRTENDPDVRPYIFDKDIEWVYVQVPVEIQGLKESMERVLKNRVDKLIELGFLLPNGKYPKKRELLELQSRLQSQLRSFPDQNVYQAISIVAEVFKVSHAIEMAETQGTAALTRYFERLNNEARSKGGSKAAKRLVQDPDMVNAMKKLAQCTAELPKINRIKEIISDQLSRNPGSRIIVFTNYRDTSELVTKSLSEIGIVKPVRFVGQMNKYKDEGLTQKEQVEILQKFKSGEFNTLVATSVAEEGLDIPSTDLVLFYEPVPSEIRSIQRKGRTGRKHAGRVVVLMARGTKDEAYYWTSNRKEKRMKKEMQSMRFYDLNVEDHDKAQVKQEILSGNKTVPDDIPETSDSSTTSSTSSTSILSGQKQLLDFNKDSIKIYVDHREIRSGVARKLENLGIEVILHSLEVGDYVLSDRTCVERKTAEDLLSSITDNRDFFNQISDLAKAYSRPIMIIEGDGLYTSRQIHPNAIRGLLASIAVDFSISIIPSKDEDDTAAILQAIARREQKEQKRDISFHGKKTAMTLKEQQEYVVSAISDIGPAAARNLLKHFKSVENVMKASREELMEVPLIGPKTADRIREVVGEMYKG